MGRRGLILILMVAAVAVAAFMAEPALAQCAMCKQTVEASSDAEAASRGLNLAVLVLLVPPVAIFAGIFGVFYRFRDFHAKRQD